MYGHCWIEVHMVRSKFIDIIPAGDLKPHRAGPDCWCKPVADDEETTVLVHRSLDGREAFESGERKPS